MRLIAEELGGERGGQPVFSDIGFSLGEGDALRQPATAWIASLVTERPSSLRSRFSSSTFIE